VTFLAISYHSIKITWSVRRKLKKTFDGIEMIRSKRINLEISHIVFQIVNFCIFRNVIKYVPDNKEGHTACDFDGMVGTGHPVSMCTTKTPIDMWRFNVPQLKKAFSVKDRYQLNYFICIKYFNGQTIASLKLN
jgi:hypothetical protein